MVVESAEGVELLLDVGLERRVTGSADVEIRADDGRWTRWQVKVLRHSPSPAEVDRALAALKTSRHDGALFVVARAGSTLTEAARRDERVAYAALSDGVVSFFGEIRRTGDERPPQAQRPGRTSWARLGALRLFALIDRHTLSQSEIARRIGVSHVAVGKQLSRLEPLIERTVKGWRAVDRVKCWEKFLADYPGPRGLVSFWTATGEVSGQLARLERVVREQHGVLVISGDVAADFYAPWKRPTRITAYVTEQPPLEERGFADVRAADAIVELRVARDPTILAMSRTWPSPDGGQRRYADPLITAWDLSRTPGGDVSSAVEELRDRAIREPLWS